MNNKDYLFTKITNLLEEVTTDFNEIKNKDSLNQVEIILLEAKCGYIKELVGALKQWNSQNEQNHKALPIHPTNIENKITPEPINQFIPKENIPVSSITTTNNISSMDIRKLMGLNDKFAILKGLFDGKAEEFEVVLNRINECNTIQDAQKYIITLQQSYKWDIKSEVYIKFVVIIKKKFGV